MSLPALASYTLAFATVLGATSIGGASTIIYVDDDSPGGDGSTWLTAYATLQDALAAAANDPEIEEIRVAGGVYRPDEGAGQANNDPHSTFSLIDGLTIRGGYAGAFSGEPFALLPDCHAPAIFRSVLTGDLVDDDCYCVDGDGECVCAYHVVTIDAGTGPETLLTGVVVTGGSDPDGIGGGGILCYGDAVLQACRIENNCGRQGGGVYIGDESEVRLEECDIDRNRARIGGGVYVDGGAPTIVESSIANNQAVGLPAVGEGRGAGLALDGSAARVIRCAIESNHAFGTNDTAGEGAGVLVLAGVSPPNGGSAALLGNTINANYTSRLPNDPGPCVVSISDTERPGRGGGILVIGDAALDVAGNLIRDNATGEGGGMAVVGALLDLTGNTITSNSAEVGGGIHYDGGLPLIENTILWDNDAEVDPDLHMASGTATFRFSIIPSVLCGRHDCGVGNYFGEPGFVNSLDAHLERTAAAVDRGENDATLPELTADLDGDDRFVDEDCAPDLGSGTAPLVDIGADEFVDDCPADVSGNRSVDFQDVLAVLAAWGTDDCIADIDGGGLVDFADIISILAGWGFCVPTLQRTAPFCDGGSTCDSENFCDFSLGAEDVMYRVSVPHDGTWLFSLCGSTFDTQLFLSSNGCEAQSLICESDDECGDLTSKFTAALPEGVYDVTVTGYGGDCGDYVLLVAEVDDPADCAP